MTASAVVAIATERKSTVSHGSLKPGCPPERQTLAHASGIDLEAPSIISEDADLKPQYPPKWQYIRSLAWCKPALALFGVYCVSLSILLMIYAQLSDVKTLEALARQQGKLGVAGEDVAVLKLALPRSFDELRTVRRTVELYRIHCGWQLASLLCAAYLFMQAFMIPGSIGINILAGSMYSFPVALLFVAVVSTVGASLNYWVARLLLKDVVANLIPVRVQAFSQEVRRHQAHLLNYMLFLRATPILPGWFISLASPIVGVPFSTFLIATGVGHQPMNFVTVQAGKALAEIHSMRDLYSVRNVAFMLAVGLVALLPVALKWWQQRQQQKSGGPGGTASLAAGIAAATKPFREEHQS